MEGSIETDLLNRLKAGFDENTGHETGASREKISLYVDELARNIAQNPREDLTIPDAVTGLRRRYLEAIKAGAIAKSRNTRALTQRHDSRPTVLGKSQGASVLSARLDQLARENQHSNLDIIDHHAHELDKISDSHHWSSTEGRRDGGPSLGTGPETKVNELTGKAQAMLNSLEAAVLQVRHDSTRQRIRLQSIKDSTHLLQSDAARGQLRALEAVRSQLTKWVEDTLAKCSAENPDEAPSGVGERRATATMKDVHKAYEEYITVRKSLVTAVHRSSAEKSNDNFDPAPIWPGASARTAVAQVHDPVMKYEQNVAILESQQSLQQVGTYLDSFLAEEKAETVDLLQRLADESQLLPGYPILVRDRTFKNASKAFKRDEKKTSDGVVEQAEAWAFAISAAEEASSAMVTKQLEQGHRAMDEVQNTLRDLSFLKETSSLT